MKCDQIGYRSCEFVISLVIVICIHTRYNISAPMKVVQ